MRGRLITAIGLSAAMLAATGASATGAAVPHTAALADGTRFHESGNAAEYISWYGASLPLGASDARAYSAEGNKAVTTVAAGYVNAHPASAFPAHRAIRIVGSLSEFVDDGQEVLPLRVEDAASCLTILGQAKIAVVPDLWARHLALGPDTACAKPRAFGPFSLLQSYRPPTSEFGFFFAGTGLTGDFNGDGKADVLIYGSESDPDAIWYGTANGFKLGPAITINGDYRPVVGDFNGDGRDDVLWDADNSFCFGNGCPSFSSSVWLGRPGTTGFLHGPAIPTPPHGTVEHIKFEGGDFTYTNAQYEPLVGDFNGDGRADVYWFVIATTEEKPSAPPPNVLWYGAPLGFLVGSSSTTPIPGRRLGVPFPGTHLVDTFFGAPNLGDFNGDGRADLLWYQPGASRLWRGTSGAFTNVVIATVYGEYRPLAGDFNGDGKADVLWYGPGTGPDSYWLGRANGFATGPAVTINGSYQSFVGDYNGDGRADIYWHGFDIAGDPPRVVTGTDYVWSGRPSGFAHSAGIVQGQLDVPAIVYPEVGDYNGDGHDDIVWWRDIFSETDFRDTVTADLWRAH